VIAGTLSFYAHESLSARPAPGFFALLRARAPVLLSVLIGLIAGAWVRLCQSASARRRELVAANQELERVNGQLKEEAQKAMLSEERFHLQFAANPYPMYIFDCHSLAISDVNEAALRQYGYTREEFLALSALDLRPQEEAARFLARLQAGDQGYSARGIWRHNRKDGTQLLAEVCVFRFQRDSGVKELVLAQDVTLRVDAEQSLRKSEAALKSMIGNAPFGLCTTSLRKDCFEDCNPALSEMLGYRREEMLSLKLSSDLWADPVDRNRMLDLLRRTRRLKGFESTLLRKDGTGIPVRLWGVLEANSEAEPDRLDLYVEDVTEHSALEQQVRQVQKLEAVGRLAGGIAHDFNNILVVIRLSTESMLSQVTLESAFTTPLLQVLNASERAAALTRQLLAFGRQQIMQARILNINAVVTDTLHLLRRTIGEDIQLVTRLCDSLSNTRLDPDQLAQVIINLAINARDAMPHGGRLEIETQNVVLDDSYVHNHGVVQPGKYVMLVVSDNGTGIEKALLPRIFDPFFTTKELGKGTGLGLSIVYGIVKQSGGYIWVYSEPGQGTTFKLYFPVTAAPVEAAVDRGELRPQTGESTVLVVEDETEIRQNLRECLHQLGYKVVEAADGVEALRTFEQRHREIDLVLTDLVMPHMSGHELAVNLARLDPQIALLFMSGYTEDNAVRREILCKGSAFLNKPFTVAELSAAVHGALAMKRLNQAPELTPT
jgi:PAS domain S-box-containing protein